ncbi:MAG TPA: immunoglobulin domain-containing protein, partial [Candidatus Dormibacteraeota bacterium]|nr:immunoglobulin domain-containing protein [Candidatus Dormibacteraeota bacterium]
TATTADFFVNNHKAEISATGGTPVSRSEDIHCNFSTFTNAQTVMYASFTVNCTNLPPAVGTYIAHFYYNGSTFHAKVFAQAPAGVLANTWRLGIAGAANTVNKIFPIDLASNVDYQVVIQWDPVSLSAATLWVNPISQADLNFTTSDAVTVGTPADAIGFGFRQAGTFGNFFCTVSNLAVATTWDEATTNIWRTNAVAPIIAKNPVTGTNFVGDPMDLTALAAGQGLAGMTYQWQKDGANVANDNGNTNVFHRASVVLSDTGNYKLIASTPYGLSVTSASVFRWITNAPIPPTILPATNSTVTAFYHQSTTLSVSASGPPPITFQWYYNNGALGPNASDDGNGNLTISDVFTNNQTAGAYYAVASNPYGSKTSGVFTVVAAGPPAVSVAFLRTLVDPVNFVATNSTLRWQVTGTVTTYTNLTTGDTASYYLQDGTGGLNIFVTHGGGSDVANVRFFAPQQGDVVTFIGFQSSFNSSLELEADTNDITTSFTILSNNLALLPPAKLIPFSITNNLPFCETNLEGSIVMLTNVYFGTNAGTVLSTTVNTTITVTNAAGETFQLLFPFEDLDIAGQTLPSFANTVLGPLTQNLGNAVTPRNQGYNITVTRFSDVVTNALTLSATHSGNSTVLTWAAAPYSYSYTVQAASSVTGPYSTLATGLRFTSFNGTFTDSSASADAKFYRLTTP